MSDLDINIISDPALGHVYVYVPSGDWWLSGGIDSGDCVGAWQAKGAASLAASYDNLTGNAAYDLTTAAAPTWNSSDGWIFDGTSQHLITGVVPASGYSMMIRFTDCEDYAGTAAIFGIANGAGRDFYIDIHPFGNNEITYYSGYELTVAPKLLTGVLGMAGNKAYRNGVAETGTMAAWDQVTSKVCYIGGYDTPNYAYIPAIKVQACAIWSATLTAPQMLAVYTAMAAL